MLAQVFIGIAAFIHFYIFLMESILWGRPRTNKVFGLTPELAEQNRLFAFNQGFYNVFLAIAATLGIALSESHPEVGATLRIYASASMIGAAAVLFYSKPKLIRAVLIQGLPPLLGLLAMAIP